MSVAWRNMLGRVPRRWSIALKVAPLVLVIYLVKLGIIDLEEKLGALVAGNGAADGSRESVLSALH